MAPQTTDNKHINTYVVNTYAINTFDDGNQKYETYTNEWIITDYNNRGKCSLRNVHEDIEIKSISCWKVEEYKK